MSDSEAEERRSQYGSGGQVSTIRSRDPSPAYSEVSARSRRGGSNRRRRSASRISSPARSRSPRRREMEILREENRALREENKAIRERMTKLENTIVDKHDELVSLLQQLRRAERDEHAEDSVKTARPAEKTAETAKISAGPARTTEPEVTEMETEAIDDVNFPPLTKAKGKKKKPAAKTQEATPKPQTAGKTTTEETPQAEKKIKIPPVILRKKEEWETVCRKLKERKINYEKASLTGEGIRIFPQTAEDHRRLTKSLADDKREYHTYSLPENRLLRVVIRGIPDGVSLTGVKGDLESLGLTPFSVQRMTSRRTKQAMPLLLVQLPEKEERVLEVKRLAGLVVRIEKQRASSDISQCHRCQRFGHAQSRCTAQARCVKCAGAHHSGDCKKAENTPAKCANCEGTHPSSYRGCPKFPKMKRTQATAQKQENPGSSRTSQTTKPGSSRPTQTSKATPPAKNFAEAAKRGLEKTAAKPAKKTAPAVASTASDLTAMLAQMQQMCAAMSTFFAQIPALSKA